MPLLVRPVALAVVRLTRHRLGHELRTRRQARPPPPRRAHRVRHAQMQLVHLRHQWPQFQPQPATCHVPPAGLRLGQQLRQGQAASVCSGDALGVDTRVDGCLSSQSADRHTLLCPKCQAPPQRHTHPNSPVYEPGDVGATARDDDVPAPRQVSIRLQLCSADIEKYRKVLRLGVGLCVCTHDWRCVPHRWVSGFAPHARAPLRCPSG